MRTAAIVAVLLALGPIASAQQLEAPQLPPSLQTLAGATSIDNGNQQNWYKLGPAFGSRSQFQIGLDLSPTITACVQREDHDGQWLVGSCRDILLLGMDGHSFFHVGGGVLKNAESGNASYTLKSGFNFGPLMHKSLMWVSEKVPGLDGIGGIKVPKFVGYLGQITTIDYAVGYRPYHDQSVNGELTRGVMANVSIPLDDLKFIQKAVGF